MRRDKANCNSKLRGKIASLIIQMKKLLDSDWLRIVQFKCNTSAKSVTQVLITHRNYIILDYDLQKDNVNFPFNLKLNCTCEFF